VTEAAAPSPGRRRGSPRAAGLAALALLSGGCALAYEVLLVRALTTVLGDMFYVHAALLATFLLGIGVGAWLAERAFRYLFAFELATGAYAFAIVVVTRELSERPFMAVVTASPGLTIAATVAAVIVPSALIGFSVPLFSAYVKAATPNRLAFQRTYTAYNLGALCSVLVVEFALVRYLGVAVSLQAVGAVNLLTGALLLTTRAAPPAPRSVAPRRLGPSLIAAVLLASVASAVFQMFFLKLFYLVFAPHRENFAVALTVPLLGLFLGALAASRWPVSFVALMSLVPVVIGTTYASFEPLVRLAKWTEPAIAADAATFLAHKLAIGALFALAPMILFGATLPALMRGEREVAHESGTLLALASAGNAAGYLLYVLGGHPYLPASGVLAGIGVLGLASAAVAARGRLPRGSAVVAGAGLVALVAMAMLWDDARFYLAQQVVQYRPDWRVATLKSGAESATLVRFAGSEWISYNGHPEIRVQKDGAVNLAEMLSGVIPALGAPRLDRALVLGIGTGITAGSTARVFKSTDAVEINEAFIRMLPRLRHANADLPGNPAATLHVADGRAFLAGRDGQYDAIVNSIPAPTYYSASKIYTVEFYARVRRALKPDGVFSLWLSARDLGAEGLWIVLSAVRQSFPHCDLRLMRVDYYMATCAAQPIRPRPFAALLVQPELLRQLQRSAPEFDLNELFADHRLSEDVFAGLTRPVQRQNTDDFPVLEFQVTRADPRAGALDPLLAQAEAIGIDPTRGWDRNDPQRAARRAALFYVLAKPYYDRFFLPRLQTDPAAMAAFQRFMEDQRRACLPGTSMASILRPDDCRPRTSPRRRAAVSAALTRRRSRRRRSARGR
jgi:spermidine synthase